MPTSLIYDAMVDGMAAGSIAFGADAFKVLLVSGYTPSKDGHAHRSDVTGEVIGSGYTAGGAAVTVTVNADPVADRTDIELGGATWAASTISATGAVYYDSRGGSAGSDELIAYIDFGGTVSSLTGLFALQLSTVQIFNP